MKINTEKTGTMAIRRHTQSLNITVQNESIKQTNEFKYLGTFFFPMIVKQNRQRNRHTVSQGENKY
jgi:hypothetical protein